MPVCVLFDQEWENIQLEIQIQYAFSLTSGITNLIFKIYKLFFLHN